MHYYPVTVEVANRMALVIERVKSFTAVNFLAGVCCSIAFFIAGAVCIDWAVCLVGVASMVLWVIAFDAVQVLAGVCYVVACLII